MVQVPWKQKNIYNRKKYLPEVFCSELLPIFEQLSVNELLDNCQKWLIQNQSESLSNVD